MRPLGSLKQQQSGAGGGGLRAPLFADLRSPAALEREPWLLAPASCSLRSLGQVTSLLWVPHLCSLIFLPSVEWAYKTSCLKGLRGLNGIKVIGGRIWCLQSTPKWLSL